VWFHCTTFYGVQGISLRPKDPDEISWMLSANGEYSANSTYWVRLLRSTTIKFHKTHLESLGTQPKSKFFGWLAIIKKKDYGLRIGSRREVGLTMLFALYRREPEIVLHLLAHDRCSIRIWQELAVSIAFNGLLLSSWSQAGSLH